MVKNVHERIVAGTPEAVWSVLADPGSLYPASSGSFELPDGLYPGAPVRHDGTRYRVAEVEPGRRLWFDVGRSMRGGHGFELRPVEGGTLVRHSIDGRLGGLLGVLWPITVRRQHDAALEGMLDNLERAMAHPGSLRTLVSGAPGAVRRAVGMAAVPPELASLVTLPNYHYLDAFTLELDGADSWTAEAWARAMFEDDRPVLVRAATRGLLGVMLSRPGVPGKIGGFAISASASHALRADSRSRLSADQVVVAVGAAGVSLVTAMRHEAPVARASWGVLSHLHRSFAPRVLRHAAGRLRAWARITR
ncbi:SRPBCC family protein [Agrococcus baldri]|uniref:SRPBCC family protein n=1 Tax=Agrococcus baldri TaxID=153730 RepID=A0AA87RAA8_9MICO|nr:SRPBCC family protein [Agrococcus baldri]GEK79429.1 hypothetical protein ABA31_07800 [Agrococcus baldri]